ncbi:fatty acyl-AMP ligase [Nonomuraea sp. MG754425]|uniref:AMP-binding protein n=1 Tax=Nonomuraea sp. MG754425 TaxID=2570319 RepID=UPI001F370472|nr:AMP-binding protein [Nonomuraea sp. MG754425]MCF6471646.1 fatty acyl-AMP ligase [Nonomuraea sp. MG754425]
MTIRGTAYDWLRQRAAADGSSGAVALWRDQQVRKGLSFGELLHLTDRVRAGLRDLGVLPGERVLISLPNDEGFTAVVLGCIGAGAIAVPAPVPDIGRREAFRDRLRAIAADCAPVVAVTLEGWAADLTGFLTTRVVTWETLRQYAADPPPGARNSPTAFLQYTSGSTGDPKGVRISHEALLSSCRQAAQVYREENSDTAVTWVPLYHDMGLITGLMRPLFSGYRSVLLTPGDFVRNPGSWLAALSGCRGTVSSAPNFAYDLCVRKISDDEAARWDLSRWRIARNAGEVVHADTMARFVGKFSSSGFRESSYCPSYGLAEATLTVSTCTPTARPIHLAVPRTELRAGEPADQRPVNLISSGVALPDTGLRISGAHGRWQVGDILVRGPQNFSGYWNTNRDHPQGADGWHATGDVGFLYADHLFVLGRSAESFTHHGQNYYLSDISRACERIDGIRAGRVAAFVVRGSPPEEEKVCLVAELSRDFAPGRSSFAEVENATKRRLASGLGLYVASVVLLKTGSMPMTTSGKVRVSEVRRRWLDGTLPPVTSTQVQPPRQKER